MKFSIRCSCRYPGNAGRIELPIKKEYAPNATVSIYLVRPGGEKSLPLERFASSEIQVRRPDRELKIEPHLASCFGETGRNRAWRSAHDLRGKTGGGRGSCCLRGGRCGFETWRLAASSHPR